MSMSSGGTEVVLAQVGIGIGISPAFGIAAALYGLATLSWLGIFVDGPKWLSRVAYWVFVIAFLAHGIDIGWRGVLGVHPGMSVREALGFLSWVMAGGYLLALFRYRLEVLGAVVSPVVLALLVMARLTPLGDPLPGFAVIGRIHISLATFGVALFAMATGAATLYLLGERSLKRKRFDGVLFRRGIALETLDVLAHRLVLLGFPIFTMALVLGAIWVTQRASGFDRVEYPLSLITWIAFAVLIVARTVRGWRGRRAAFVTIAGFLAAVLVLAIYLARRALG